MFWETTSENRYEMVLGWTTSVLPNPRKSPWMIESVWGNQLKQQCRMFATLPWKCVSISSWEWQSLILTLLKADLVETKNWLLAGLVPKTIAGEPSIFSEISQSELKKSRTDRSPVRIISSKCSWCLLSGFFITLSLYYRDTLLAPSLHQIGSLPIDFPFLCAWMYFRAEPSVLHSFSSCCPLCMMMYPLLA